MTRKKFGLLTTISIWISAFGLLLMPTAFLYADQPNPIDPVITPVTLNQDFVLGFNDTARVIDYYNLLIINKGVVTPTGCIVGYPCEAPKVSLSVIFNSATQNISLSKGQQQNGIFGASITAVDFNGEGTVPVTLYVSAPIKSYGPGANVKTSDGTIWFIDNNFQRRPYTSAGALLSYGFNSWASVVEANNADLSLTVGDFVPPSDGRVFCSDRGLDRGTCYLMTEGKKAGFISEAVFKGLGFNFSQALWGDISFVTLTTNISSPSEVHRAGVLVNNNGEIDLVTPNCLAGIPSLQVFNSWGFSFQNSVPANSADKFLLLRNIVSEREPGLLYPYYACAVPAPLPAY